MAHVRWLGAAHATLLHSGAGTQKWLPAQQIKQTNERTLGSGFG